MGSEKGDDAYLWDMLDAAQSVRQFVAGRSFDDYVQDAMLRGAVERQIEIVGEAARHVSPAFQAVHREIPWRGIIAQRHVIAHDYGDIKHDRLWAVATGLIPKLVQMLEPLVPPDPQPEA